MPAAAGSLQFYIRVIAISISTILLSISLAPAIEVAVCEDKDMKVMPVSLQELVDRGDKYGIAVYWLLWASILLSLARLMAHITAFRVKKTCPLFNIADISASIVICAIIITAMITILYRILNGDDCEFKDGASPFVGLGVASSGTMLSTTIFEVFTLISESASPYEELAVQQDGDETAVIAMTGCGGDCTSNMERTEIESLNSELQTVIESASDREDDESVL